MYIVDGMVVIDKKLHIIKVHLLKSKAAGITDDGAPTTEKIDGKGENMIASQCMHGHEGRELDT